MALVILYFNTCFLSDWWHLSAFFNSFFDIRMMSFGFPSIKHLYKQTSLCEILSSCLIAFCVSSGPHVLSYGRLLGAVSLSLTENRPKCPGASQKSPLRSWLLPPLGKVSWDSLVYGQSPLLLFVISRPQVLVAFFSSLHPFSYLAFIQSLFIRGAQQITEFFVVLSWISWWNLLWKYSYIWLMQELD